MSQLTIIFQYGMVYTIIGPPERIGAKGGHGINDNEYVSSEINEGYSEANEDEE